MSDQGTWRGRLAAVAAIAIPAAIALGQVAFFWSINSRQLGLGFPIDDAYIFKRYAENFAAGHGFSFNPGEISFGCTSLLWPVMMAMAIKLFGVQHYIAVAHWLGGAFFAGTAGIAAATVTSVSRRPLLGLIAGLLVAASPMALMNAISGMETGLTFLLVAALAATWLGTQPRPILAGALAGLATLCRPEGLYFIVGFAVAMMIARVLGDRRVSGRWLVSATVPWAALSIPAYAYVYIHTGGLLPTTYLGKMISSNPAMLERPFSDRLITTALSLLGGWYELGQLLRILAFVVVAGLLVQVLGTLYRIRKASVSAWQGVGSLILAGYLFLPAIYGFSFPVGPAFGGYYFRYIAPIHVVIVILAALGMGRVMDRWVKRSNAIAKSESLIMSLTSLVAICYLSWLWSFQIISAKEVYQSELSLNVSLRMEAARWIADDRNTPPDARLLVGYTGLGVVGGNCQRYVLDLGALINPDIFVYYKRATMDPLDRWRKIVNYMSENQLDYYVTFAASESLALPPPDPAQTPGFTEIKRIGTVFNKPKSPYEQIRIYHVDWVAWKKGWENR